MTNGDLAAALFVMAFFVCCLVYAWCDLHELAKEQAEEERPWLLAQVPGREDEAA